MTHVSQLATFDVPGISPLPMVQEYLTGQTRADQVYSDRGWYGDAWTMVGLLVRRSNRWDSWPWGINTYDNLISETTIFGRTAGFLCV